MSDYTLADGRVVTPRSSKSKDQTAMWFTDDRELFEKVVAYLAFESRTQTCIPYTYETGKPNKFAVMSGCAALDAANRRFKMYGTRDELAAELARAFVEGRITARELRILIR